MKILPLLFKAVRKIKNLGFGKIYTPYAILKFILNDVAFGYSVQVRGRMRIFVTKRGVFSIGNGTKFNSGPAFNVSGGAQRMTFWVDGKLEIGNNVGMSSSAILCKHHIVIGDNVTVGGNTLIIDSDSHSINANVRIDRDKDRHGARWGKIIICDNVFIGTRSTILKGVTIGKDSVVGACSVVTKSIPENEIWGGNPAKFIKKVQ
ncbi:MAG: acetyltransferase-like isoleucine patch superfamily enzyme [Paraglaciecola sp.]|jgi:acetyltransferase-like isoleucine patch superfamily enzyme